MPTQALSQNHVLLFLAHCVVCCLFDSLCNRHNHYYLLRYQSTGATTAPEFHACGKWHECHALGSWPHSHRSRLVRLGLSCLNSISFATFYIAVPTALIFQSWSRIVAVVKRTAVPVAKCSNSNNTKHTRVFTTNEFGATAAAVVLLPLVGGLWTTPILSFIPMLIDDD